MPQSQQIKRKKQSQITLFSNGGVQKSIARQCLRYLSLLTFSFGPRKNAQALDSVVYSLAFTFCARSQALVCSLTSKAPSTRIRIFLNPQFSFSVHSSSDSLRIYYFPLWRANLKISSRFTGCVWTEAVPGKEKVSDSKISGYAWTGPKLDKQEDDCRQNI